MAVEFLLSNDLYLTFEAFTRKRILLLALKSSLSLDLDLAIEFYVCFLFEGFVYSKSYNLYPFYQSPE